MAKKKSKKVGLFSMLMAIASVIGIVLAVVGLVTPFFQQVTSSIIGDPEPTMMGLFDDYSLLEAAMDGNLTVTLVMVFAIVSVVLSALAAVITVLGTVGAVKVGGLAKFIGAALVIVVAVLVVVFAAAYAAQSPLNLDAGAIVKTSFQPAVGAYLVMIGGIVSGVGMLLAKLK